MDIKRLSRQTCRLTDPPGVVSWASVAGRLERQGPLGGSIDITDDDSFFGKKTWEQGEAEMQALALRRALRKGGLTPQDVDCIFAGDLLNQNIGATFSLRDFDIPFYGVYGACSTMGESLSLAAMAVAGGFARIAAAQTSSHFCTAERQYRAPVPYGSQRAPTAQWTATAAGCCVVGVQSAGPYITHTTRGRIVDLGVTDAANMGAAMAPAAHDTLTRPVPRHRHNASGLRSHRHRRPGLSGPRPADGAVPPRRRRAGGQLHRLRPPAVRPREAGHARRRLRLRLLRRRPQRLSAPRPAAPAGGSVLSLRPPARC